MKGDHSCITLIDKFKSCILNRDVIEMIAYGYNRKGLPDKDNVEAYNKLLRFAGYRSFLSLLELHGLGKSRRYRLPTCVIAAIRDQYPSATGAYVGFKDIESTEGASETLKCF